MALLHSNILKRTVLRTGVSISRMYKRPPNVSKCGMNLVNLISNRDKKKHWHLTVMAKPEKSKNIFEKVHKPKRREVVLNTLFMENITDVISTGDVAPEVMGYGIEIMGVKITSDYRIVNVFWQIPLSKQDISVNIQALLAQSAPRIRAELISRNILGKMPHIYFVQDKTNESVTEFQKALESLDVGPESEASIVPDQEFLKEVMIFKSAREEKNRKLEDKKGRHLKMYEALDTSEKDLTLSIKEPVDMRSDIFGLDHAYLMNKVVTAKKKKPEPIQTETPVETDLFDKIPGQPLHSADREKMLKQFHVQRKIELKKRLKLATQQEEVDLVQSQEINEVPFLEQDYEPDYFEEECDYNDNKM